jgi:hypothetical protein
VSIRPQQPWNCAAQVNLLSWTNAGLCEREQYDDRGIFAPGNEGAHILRVDIDGKVSNEASFSVARCPIELILDSNEYCTGHFFWRVRSSRNFIDDISNRVRQLVPKNFL